jgi:hypothetical protein
MNLSEQIREKKQQITGLEEQWRWLTRSIRDSKELQKRAHPDNVDICDALDQQYLETLDLILTCAGRQGTE